ncbi:MAG: helix-turn-helix domain-containing protein [Acidaminococcaceae bacterium]|nr:helix-turn-helix domain-containing protein [Acidaminococcaceae bacterium]
MDILKILDKWYQAESQVPSHDVSKDDIAYIMENTSLLVLPDGSRNLGDVVTISCMQTNTNREMKLYYASLAGHRRFLSSFPYPDEYTTPLHSHNHIELCYVISGSFTQIISSDRVNFSRGEICIIDPECRHADYISSADSTVLFLAIDNVFFEKSYLSESQVYGSSQFVQDVILDKKKKYNYAKCIPRANACQVPELFRKIVEEFSEQRAGTLHLVLGYVERLLACIPSEYQMLMTQKEHSELQSLLYRDIRTYIMKHYQKVNTQILANEFGYNRDYFTRIIHKYSGMTLTELIQLIRIEKAEQLLIMTTHSVETISEMVGYSNLGFFYRKFQEKHHMTPTEYRTRQH